MKSILVALVLLASSAMPAFSQDCPAGQVLVPKLGGVTCQAMPHCPAGTTMGIGAGGFECMAEQRHVAVTKNLFAFFALRTEGVMDGICMAWIPAYSPYETKVRDEFLDASNHADGAGWVAALSYEIDDAATKITLTQIRHWQRDGNGRRAFSEPTPLKLEVPLYDKPQPSWPCSKRTWTALLEIPAPRQGDPTFGGKGGWAPPNPLATRCGTGSLTYYTMNGHC